MLRFALLLSFAAVGFLSISPTPATSADPVDAKAPSAEQLADWIAQLDSEEYAAREAASENLAAAGAAAIESLAKAAASDSLEVSTRALNLLQALRESSDAADVKAATAALERLRNSDHAATARRAKDILEPPKPAEAAPMGIRLGGPQGIRLAVPMQGNVIAARKSISVKNINGVKEITVEENDRKVKIVDDANKGVKMEITETVNGKETTRTVEAKNAEELKKKDAKAHKLYEEYNQDNAGAVQLQIQAIGGGIQILPGQPGIQIAPALPAPALPNITARRIEMLQRQMESVSRQLEGALKDIDANDEARKALQACRKELKKQLKAVEEALEEPAEAEEEAAEEEAVEAEKTAAE